VTTTGVVQPTLLVQVGSQLSGDIVEVLVDFNDTVAKGQSLARLDPESFEAAVREADAALAVARAGEQFRRQAIEQFRARIDAAQAELAVAQAQLVRAQAERNGKVVDLKRTEPLAQRGTMPQKDLDDAKTAVAMSAANVKEAEATVQARQAAVQSADAELKMARVDLVMAQAGSDKQQAALDVAQADLERTIIRAPIDGVVVGRSVNVGQTVVASLDSPTLFTVAEDIRRMEVHASVDEADIGQIRNGQSATFSVDAYPERSFQGTVRQIRKAPTVIQNVVTYTIVIATDNADLTLMPGMTALVRIVTGDGASGQQLSQS
jgi:HlyD family secretion protein